MKLDKIESELYYAHTQEHAPRKAWHVLDEHLRSVAETASRFAAAFGAADWGYAAGLWHDLGKYAPAFQNYLLRNVCEDYHRADVKGNVDHSSAGAQHAVERVEILGHLLAYAIAGHHAGLLDGVGEGASLDKRLRKSVDPWKHGLRRLPDIPPPRLPGFLQEALGKRASDPKGAAFAFAFFARMIFSCLVDADFLDTEQYMDPERSENRPRWPAHVLSSMEEALSRYVCGLPGNEGMVDGERRRVREACLGAAALEPGLFSLTVPTGGGKTLSSLAFALRHACTHGHKRIIYVIPFTSIIEQNADVFRDVFSHLICEGFPDPVLEHHSAVDAEMETVESRLAAENWDAPLVVTTSVQFYESLFSHRASRCRKLHNMARSVIILDEAQKIPVNYLHSCLAALRELTSHYGCSVVLCTATQPALHHRADFPIGLKGVREIVEDPRALYTAFKRVAVRDLGSLGDDELAGLLAHERAALCIVNTRRHARELFGRLETEGDAVHLSAAMTPAHRSEILQEVRRRLMEGSGCRVISTQLVEAGVDLDFPVVYRSLAGLDSLVQAAGRCNRNGRMVRGITYLFRSEHGREEVFLRDTVNAAVQIVGNGSVPPLYDDLLCLESVEHYFRLYYWDQQSRWDQKGILEAFSLENRRDFPFLFAYSTVGERFRLIEDYGRPVIVPWGDEAARLCRELRARPPVGLADLLRRLQRHIVQVPQRLWYREIGRSFELVHDRFPVLISPEIHYHPKLGLILEDPQPSAETLIL